MSTKSDQSSNGDHDVHDLIERAKKFSLRVPVVGSVKVPPPDQLAFYGALGLLAALNVIDWPVALAVGVGEAVLARHFNDNRRGEEQSGKPEAHEAHARTTAPAEGHKTAAKAAHS